MQVEFSVLRDAGEQVERESDRVSACVWAWAHMKVETCLCTLKQKGYHIRTASYVKKKKNPTSFDLHPQPKKLDPPDR